MRAEQGRRAMTLEIRRWEALNEKASHHGGDRSVAAAYVFDRQFSVKPTPAASEPHHSKQRRTKPAGPREIPANQRNQNRARSLSGSLCSRGQRRRRRADDNEPEGGLTDP